MVRRVCESHGINISGGLANGLEEDDVTQESQAKVTNNAIKEEGRLG